MARHAALRTKFFTGSLRYSVAATMNLEELQEQRATFVKAVQDAVGADIQNNGSRSDRML